MKRCHAIELLPPRHTNTQLSSPMSSKSVLILSEEKVKLYPKYIETLKVLYSYQKM